MVEKTIFISSLFRYKRDLTKEVKQRKVDKSNETTLGFQDEEGPCTSYQQKKNLVLHRAPKKHTMPFPFEEEDKRHGDGGHLDHEILSEYLAEYKSQPRAFKENLTLPQFIQLKGERRPCSNRFLLSTFDGSYIGLHLEGEANIRWFNHLSHAKVTAYADFTQKLIKNFDKKKSEEKKPSPPLTT